MISSKNVSKLITGESQNPQKGCDNASLNTLIGCRMLRVDR